MAVKQLITKPLNFIFSLLGMRRLCCSNASQHRRVSLNSCNKVSPIPTDTKKNMLLTNTTSSANSMDLIMVPYNRCAQTFGIQGSNLVWGDHDCHLGPFTWVSFMDIAWLCLTASKASTLDHIGWLCRADFSLIKTTPRHWNFVTIPGAVRPIVVFVLGTWCNRITHHIIVCQSCTIGKINKKQHSANMLFLCTRFDGLSHEHKQRNN